MNAKIFLNTLAFFLNKYYPEEMDPNLKPMDSSGCVDCRNILFDFIIVGAGSAGCIVANRLSANPKWNILLIEAGGDENYISDTPGMATHLNHFAPQYFWNFTTVHTKDRCTGQGGQCTYRAGHVMGGSSTINGMLLVRGQPQIYDGWEKMGNRGWSFNDVFPFFLKAENMTIPSLQKSKYHSTKGPVPVSFTKYRLPVYEDLIKAGNEFDLPFIDYNGPGTIGIGYSQNNIQDSVRCSMSMAYLEPIRNRKNLYIFKHTLVTKIIFNDRKRAVGVKCLFNGEEFVVRASKEVIISAGVINTPKLLMLSGIGPRNILDNLEIPVYADLPVGERFVDHAALYMNFTMDFPKFFNCCNRFSEEAIMQYAKHKSGPLADPFADCVAYLGAPTQNVNDEISTLLPMCRDPLSLTMFNIGVRCTENVVFILLFISQPTSVGSVSINSTKYNEMPLISPNIFGTHCDMELTKWAMRQTLKFMSQPALAKYSPKWLNINFPGCVYTEPVTEDYLECYIKYNGYSLWHGTGTARMGIGKASVVDPTLKLHTMKNLRIVDASVMPTIPNSNIHAAVIMIGEKGATMILDEHR